MISVDDFKDAFKHYTVTYLHEDWSNSFIEKRQAVNKKNYRFNFTITDEDIGQDHGADVPQPTKAAVAKKEPPLDNQRTLSLATLSAPGAAAAPSLLEQEFDDTSDIQQGSSMRLKKKKGMRPGAAMNLMLTSEGDDGGDEEEDEDDEM